MWSNKVESEWAEILWFFLLLAYIKISKRQKRRKLTEHFCDAVFLSPRRRKLEIFTLSTFVAAQLSCEKEKKSKKFPFETRKLYMPCKIEKFRTSQKKCLLSTEWNENLFKFHDRNSSEMRMKRMYAKSGFCVEKSWTISRDSLNFFSDYELLIASAVSSPLSTLFFADFPMKTFLVFVFFYCLKLETCHHNVCMNNNTTKQSKTHHTRRWI